MFLFCPFTMIHNAHRSFLTGDLCPYVSEYTPDLNITKYPRYQVRNVTLPNVFLITYLAYVHFPVDKVPGKPIVNCIAFDHMCKMALALDIGTTACVGWLIVGTAATSLAWMSMVKPFVNTGALDYRYRYPRQYFIGSYGLFSRKLRWQSIFYL